MINFNEFTNYFNSASKLVTFSIGLSDDYGTVGDIQTRIINRVGKEVWTPSPGNIKSYLNKHLVSPGLIKSKNQEREEEITVFGKYKTTVTRNYDFYKRTVEGEGIVDVVNYLIIKSVDFDGLFHILGRSGSARQNPGKTKIQILEDLLTNQTMRVSDFNTTTTEACTNLIDLKKVEMIEYDSAKGKGWSKYIWIGGDKNVKENPKHVSNCSTQRVIELLKKEKKPIDVHYARDKLGYKTNTHITTIFTHLENLGLVKHASKFKFDEQSIIKIKQKGRDFYNELIQPVKDYFNNNQQTINNLLATVTKNELYQKSSILLNKQHEKSPQANRKIKEEWEQKIIDYIKKNGLSRPTDLIKHFNNKSIPGKLARMIKRKKLVKIKLEPNSLATYYYLPPSDS